MPAFAFFITSVRLLIAIHGSEDWNVDAASSGGDASPPRSSIVEFTSPCFTCIVNCKMVNDSFLRGSEAVDQEHAGLCPAVLQRPRYPWLKTKNISCGALCKIGAPNPSNGTIMNHRRE